jgi:methylase of polypeptide subunit release factors
MLAPFTVKPADLPALRAFLAKLGALGYNESRILARLALNDLCSLNWRAIPIYRSERLATRDPQALAIDLFLLQGSLAPNEFPALLTPVESDLLIRNGIVTIDGYMRSNISLYPVSKRLIFSDHAWPELPHPGFKVPPYDLVMAVGVDSRHLARCTVRQPIDTALDLCTGSGIHALLASSHARHVTAVDISPRAAQCAGLNAQLAANSNFEVLTGDLFAPVQGRRFELITANPPFVPSPLDTLCFRDGGSSGEDIQKRIVRGIADHLAPGGTAQMITELGERENETLSLRIREWLNGAPLDFHILRLNEHSAEKYAIGHAKGDDYPAFLESIHQWHSNLRAHGYLRVVSVVVTFQWSQSACGAPWDREDRSAPPTRAAGREIEAIFAAERAVRRPDFNSHRRFVPTGEIALLDASMPGRNLQANAKASLLGQALTLEYRLDPDERGSLARMAVDPDYVPARESIQSLVRRRILEPLTNAPLSTPNRNVLISAK